MTARRAATRDKLVDAAITVFADKGVLGASVEEICEAADFTRGAFYSNFASKDELCSAVLERQFADQMTALNLALASVDMSATDDLDELLPATLEVFFGSRPTDRDWVLTAQALRLHAARAPEFARAYRDAHCRGTEAVSSAIEQALAARGFELVINAPEALGVLHAVHEYGTLGSLIGSDVIEGDVKVRLLTEVLRALIRPVGVSSTSGR